MYHIKDCIKSRIKYFAASHGKNAYFGLMASLQRMLDNHIVLPKGLNESAKYGIKENIFYFSLQVLQLFKYSIS